MVEVARQADKLFFGFDVAGSTQMETSQLVAMRALIFPSVFQALKAVGLRPRQYELREAGDGGVVIVDRAIDEGTLLVQVLPGVVTRIHASVHEEPLRLRYALHAGDVHQDRQGYFGGELSTTFRIVDAQGLRDYLQMSGETGVVAASPEFVEQALGTKSSLSDTQRHLLQGWDTITLHNKEMHISAYAAPISDVVLLAGVPAMCSLVGDTSAA